MTLQGRWKEETVLLKLLYICGNKLVLLAPSLIPLPGLAKLKMFILFHSQQTSSLYIRVNHVTRYLHIYSHRGRQRCVIRIIPMHKAVRRSI